MYCEENTVGGNYRREYLQSVRKLIVQKEKETALARQNRGVEILKNPDKARQELKDMLGWPLCEKREGIPNVRKEFVTTDDGISIYRLSFEIFPDFYFYGMLFLNGEEKLPLVISQHGGLGTPESCSSLWNNGNSSNYNDMTRRVLKEKVHIFAPQLLLWRQDLKDDKGENMNFERGRIDQALKTVGSSITALEVFCLQRCIDYLQEQPYVQADSIGMVGLSYGGFYTMMLSAIDERIKSAIASCNLYLCSIGMETEETPIDRTWFDMRHKFTESEIAMLTYPRFICFQNATGDELIPVDKATGLYEEMKEICRKANISDSWLDYICFEGTHEFYKEDAPIRRLAEHLKSY